MSTYSQAERFTIDQCTEDYYGRKLIIVCHKGREIALIWRTIFSYRGCPHVRYNSCKYRLLENKDGERYIEV
jgi:hypothetical protein